MDLISRLCNNDKECLADQVAQLNIIYLLGSKIWQSDVCHYMFLPGLKMPTDNNMFLKHS